MKRFCRYLLLSLALMPLFSFEAAGAPYSIRVGKVPALRASTVATLCGMWRGRTPVDFGNKTVKLRITPRKLPVYISGLKVFQCYPSWNRYGTYYISRLDFEKTLLPLSGKGGAVQKRAIRTIVIDPGHGGKDRGASGLRSREKDITLAISRRVAEILRACGYRVYLTRNRDVYLPLASRSRRQRELKGDLFISIHVNAVKDRRLSGIECFALTPAGAPSTSGGKIPKDKFSGNSFDGNNILLAASLQRAMLRRTRAVDRGVKRARFAVLKDINAPGALVEVGFISNRREEWLLNTRQYREKIARGIAEGVVSYHRASRR